MSAHDSKVMCMNPKDHHDLRIKESAKKERLIPDDII